MGFYTACFMFYGVVCGKIGYTKLIESKEYKENEEKYKSYIKQMTSDTWLFYIPNSLHYFRAFDSMLEKSDIERGFLLKEEIDQILMNHFSREIKEDPKNKLSEQEKKEQILYKFKEYYTLKEEELTILKEIIRLTTSEIVESKWYYMEGGYSTLDLGTENQSSYPYYEVNSKYEIKSV